MFLVWNQGYVFTILSFTVAEMSCRMRQWKYTNERDLCAWMERLC